MRVLSVGRVAKNRGTDVAFKHLSLGPNAYSLYLLYRSTRKNVLNSH